MSFLGSIVGLHVRTQPAAAQDQGYVTYVSLWAVPRSEWAALEKQEAASRATLQKLVADRTILAWGDEAARMHQEDGYTHADWFTATSRANLLKALEAQWAGATNATFVATTKHRDLFLHTLAHGGQLASVTTGYIRVTSWQAKPAAGDACEGYVAKYVKPTLDAAVAKARF